MRAHHRTILAQRPSLSLVLLVSLLGVLWLAGGASRADVVGQVVVRGAAWTALLLVAIAGPPPVLRPYRGLWVLFAAIAALPLLQLVPLPPDIWQSLPGRTVFAEAAAASGQPQPWRPWSIVPGATANALSSLVVPLAVLVLLTGLTAPERRLLPSLLVAAIGAAMIVGLLQFSGAGFNNPFVNDTPGEVAGTFANRNHFALFLAIGCLAAPVWAYQDGHQPGWRGPVALGLVLLFVLTILATGSRAGLLLGLVAGLGALVLVQRSLRRMLRRYPKWVFPAAVAAIFVVVALLIAVSIGADRAASVNRALTAEAGEDMRGRALPTVLAMIRTYFPVGSGLGGFDPLFRLHEPFQLLKLTYYNHAHNDFLEVLLDTGLFGLAVLLAALGWYVIGSLAAWRAGPEPHYLPARLGSAMLLVILLASAFDYPARTPMIMATIMLAAFWLSGSKHTSGSALPTQDQHL